MNAVFIYSARFPETAGSIVLQALIPARHLGAKALYFGGALDAASFLDQHMPDVLIFTKLYDENTLRLAVEAKRRGVAVIGVICDLHLTDQIGRANKQLSEIADELVVPLNIWQASCKSTMRGRSASWRNRFSFLAWNQNFPRRTQN